MEMVEPKMIVVPKHWLDTKHEPDGTAFNHIVIPGSTVEDRVGQLTTGVNDGAQKLQHDINALDNYYESDNVCVDDVSGALLDEKLLRQARALEMDFFETMGVWAERLPKSVAKARGGKVIQGRWVDVNKGDAARPDYRSRFVANHSILVLIQPSTRRRHLWKYSSY